MKICPKDFVEMATKLEDSRQISSDILMSDEFIQKTTKFKNWQEFIAAGGIENDGDFEKFAYSAFIMQNMPFEKFDAMNKEAIQEYLEKMTAE